MKFWLNLVLDMLQCVKLCSSICFENCKFYQGWSKFNQMFTSLGHFKIRYIPQFTVLSLVNHEQIYNAGQDNNMLVDCFRWWIGMALVEEAKGQDLHQYQQLPCHHQLEMTCPSNICLRKRPRSLWCHFQLWRSSVRLKGKGSRKMTHYTVPQGSLHENRKPYAWVNMYLFRLMGFVFGLMIFELSLKMVGCKNCIC